MEESPPAGDVNLPILLITLEVNLYQLIQTKISLNEGSLGIG